MATSFPTGLDALTNPVSTDTLASPSHADQHANVNDAIEALEAKVGVNSSAVTSSLDYKIANIPATSITSGTLNNARLPAAATNITSVGTLSSLALTGNITSSDGIMELGVGRATNGLVYIDLISDTVTYTDYSLRILRSAGADAPSTITHRGTGNFNFSTNEAAPIIFNTTNAERMRIDSAGNVGIGTATPFQSAGYGALTIDGSGGSIISGRVAGTETFRIQSTAASTTLNSITALPILFNTTNAERMRITASGLVGIGTSSPTVRLEVAGSTTISSQTNVAAAFGTTTSGRLLVGSITGNTPFIGAEGASNLLFYTDAVERMRIDSVGQVGIGATPAAGRTLSVSKNITGSTLGIGVVSNGTIQSDVTSTLQMFRSAPSTAAASFTLGTAVHFYCSPVSIGAGSTVTSQSGFVVDSDFTTATNNYGFAGNIPSGTNRWNLHMAGTAGNYMAGRLGVGATLTSGAMAQILNTTAADKAFIVKGAASQSGSLFDIQSSAGTSLVVVNSAGNLVIGSGTAVASVSGVTSSNQILGSSAATSSMLLSRYSADTNGPSIYFGKSRNATVGSHTANTSGDRLGNINFTGSDGTNFVAASSISADSEGTISTGVVPGRLLFFTANSAGTLTERMRITSAGDVGIGTNTPTSKLHVVGSFSRGAPVTKTASFTLADTENWIICNGASNITVTLPAASTQVGREISLKNIAGFTVVSATANVVPINSATAGTTILTSAGTWATLVSDGTNWVIMQS